MLEAYLFLAMFSAQIVVLTVLYPMMLVGRVRAQMARYPVERFPQLYPGEPADIASPLGLYRLLNAIVAVVGLVLLGWFFTYMRGPDWDDGPVEALLGVFFLLQVIPTLPFVWSVERTNKRLRNLVRDQTRTAVLQRRNLFDFVSPVVVFVTLLCYPLFVALVVYIQQDPFPGFKGYVNVAFVTALYALTAICVHHTLYGKKRNPLQTHADRMRRIGVAVKVCVYVCLASVVFLSLNFTLVLLDLQRWEPLAQSAFIVIFALLYLNGLHAPPSELNVERLRSKLAS